MSGAPFRDMFVELPRALFDVLKGALTAALATSAVERIGPSSRPSIDSYLVRPLMHRYDLQRLVIERSATDCVRVLTALLRCGHLHKVQISDKVMVLADRAGDRHEFLDVLDDGFAVRSCYCVQCNRC